MIEVEQLTKQYGAYPAIADLSFSVEPGEILGFLGPNGAGKTTTMRILTGYLPATSGTAKIAGFDVHRESMEVRKRIGYLPETPPLYLEMTVEAYLHFVAELKGISPGDRISRVDSALARCGLADRRRSHMYKLSKGYRQRVGIAQAIVHDPPVIVLDEPTVGLDPRQIIEVRQLIKSLAGEHTIILSTHILPEVSATCDRVTIINKGRVVTTNSPESLMNDLIGSGGYVLEVVGDRQQAEQILADVPGVQSVSGEPEQEGNRHRFTVAVASGVEGRSLAAAIVRADLGLCELRPSRASLEDVFLKLTTQETGQDSSQDSGQETGQDSAAIVEVEDLDRSADSPVLETPNSGSPDSNSPDSSSPEPPSTDSEETP
jgi:ABC-2 type transport system ATP-binding protein